MEAGWAGCIAAFSVGCPIAVFELRVFSNSAYIVGVRTFSFTLLIVACMGSFSSAAEPEPTPGEWKLISTSENVSIYRRSRPGPGHYETKAIGEISAPTAAVHAVIDDVEEYPRFMPYTVESRLLKKEGNVVLGYQRISTPMISDRDYTLQVRTTITQIDGGAIYRSRWETANSAGPAVRPGIVRVGLCEGGWLLEPAGTNATRATYSVYTDSGGSIPAFVKNIGSQIGIRKIFAAIRKQVLDPKYGEGKR